MFQLILCQHNLLSFFKYVRDPRGGWFSFRATPILLHQVKLHVKFQLVLVLFSIIVFTEMDFEVEGDGLFKHNDTYEYDGNYEYKEEHEFTEDSSPLLLPLLCSAVLAVGLPGNGLLLTTLFRKRHSWNISDTFVLHLCIADVLLLLTLPLYIGQAVQWRAWEFGLMSCKVNKLIFYVSLSK